MTTHELKTDKRFFDPIMAGHKVAELRFNDREFARGDRLLLAEYSDEAPTGRKVLALISHILRSGDVPGLTGGYVVLSFRILDRPA